MLAQVYLYKNIDDFLCLSICIGDQIFGTDKPNTSSKMSDLFGKSLKITKDHQS